MYIYGMRMRGFAPGCQPMAGLVDWEDTDGGKYYSILTYSRELTSAECADYDIERMQDKMTEERLDCMASMLYDQGIRADDYNLIDDLLEDYDLSLRDAEAIQAALERQEAEDRADAAMLLACGFRFSDDADDAAEEVGAGIVDPASQNCEAIREYMEEMQHGKA